MTQTSLNVSPLRGMARRRSAQAARTTDRKIPRHERDWVNTAELVIDSGASFRQIDYWTRTGLLIPAGVAAPGNGNDRHYPTDQLDRAKAVVALLAAGVDLAKLREHIDHLVTHGGYQVGPVTITYTPDN